MNPPRRYDLVPGRVLANQYIVESLLGRGYEGEVYLVREVLTGAHRAAKIFYPDRNPRNNAATHYAKKLERLRDCSILIQYHHAVQIRLRGQPVSVLISEFVDGMLLPDLLSQYRGKRMPPHEALTVLHAIASGLAELHETWSATNKWKVRNKAGKPISAQDRPPFSRAFSRRVVDPPQRTISLTGRVTTPPLLE